MGKDVYVDDISAKVKHLSIVDYAEGMEAFITAKEKEGIDATHLLGIATEKFRDASLSDPNNYLIILQWGNALYELAKLTAAHNAEPLYESAYARYQTVIEISPSCYDAHVMWGFALLDNAKNKVKEKKHKLIEKAGKSSKVFRLISTSIPS
jgi:hypothetical protein